MKKNGFFICFTGIDGAGKTTLAKELSNSLIIEGIKSNCVYARLKPFLLKPFILIGESIFLRKKDIFDNYLEYSDTKKKALKEHSFLSKIYQKILLFDYFLQISFKIKLPLLLGKNIVCDRYIYDSVVTDISVDMNYSKDMVLDLLDSLFFYFPKPDITFLVDLPEEIAFKRKNDIPSIAYLKDRRNMYLEVGNHLGMVILDGSKTLDKQKKIIYNIVEEVI